ncbi:hypothetical protein ACVXHM_34155 [Pseudomonas aeruginosa]|nr:hypothetical protein [Pseudomonas aeruginosa]UTN35980.1 hypothetical protein MMZ75_34180 [Pseudomonas aeruginosa]
MSAIDDYFAALQRLVDSKTRILPKGSDINKDAVALEAGRKRGSIKKSRAEHAEIIIAIVAAAAAQLEQQRPTPAQEIEKQRVLKGTAKKELLTLKKNYELALSKIISLVHENHLLKSEIKELKLERGKNNIRKLHV